MKVLIASGGSGGHIFPAISLARELEKENVEIIFVASRRDLDRNILKNTLHKKVFLSANPMPYRFSHRIITFLIRLTFDSLHALCTLIGFRPDVVIGFGGYTAGSILLLAAIMNIKTIIHEQNVVPGRTNMFLDKLVDEIAISFPETKKYFKNNKIVFTGNPIREESLVEERSLAFKNFGLENKRLTILVMGGSQGAASLNDLVSKSVSLLSVEKKEKIQLIHITGLKNRDKIQEHYNNSGIRSYVFGFIQNINEVYSACDLAISRSGAAAISELAAFKKPMILIPYPHEKNNQRFNAQFFAKNGAAIYKDEKGLREAELKDLIAELIDNPDKRMVLAENAGKLSVIDGAKRLKDEIMRLSGYQDIRM